MREYTNFEQLLRSRGKAVRPSQQTDLILTSLATAARLKWEQQQKLKRSFLRFIPFSDLIWAIGRWRQGDSIKILSSINI